MAESLNAKELNSMNTYSAVELAEIIEKHRKWLDGEEGGDRASFDGARLEGARFDGARLDRASFDGARLEGARFDGARLYRASFDGARLDGARLEGARLEGARFDGARLDRARLEGARLEGARFDGARLEGARFDGARLDRASFDGARLDEISSLRGCTGNLIEIKSIQCDLWPVTYTAERMQIGCQFRTLAEWWAFTGDEIGAMDSRAPAWWSIWKPLLQKIIEVSPAKPTVKSE
jgi:hypothetical protein